MNHKLKIFIILLFFVCIKSHYKQAPYADWVHDHVVWINGKQQNQQKIQKLVVDYQSYGIPVGGVNIDSAWSLGFNDFVFNRNKFPDPQGLVKRFHSQGIKVLLWATSMINKQCSLYEEGVKNHYFLNKGKLVKWWHGNGAFVDFTSKAATQWFYKQVDKVLDIGIDGFKCDGTDPMIALLQPPINYKGRIIGLHQYGHLYYGTFYNHTKSRNPNGVIMSRPMDSLKHLIYWGYSPKYMMFAGWVGDQDSTPQGFKQAMFNILHSAWKGYLNFGSDIGGYRGQHITKNIFLRWVQLGSLVPYMENGGNGRHQPWEFDQETVQIYKKFVLLHQQLKPYFLKAGTQAFPLRVSVIEPIATKQPSISLFNLDSFGYILWKDILVFPIFDQFGLANMKFPKGHRWVYYFDHNKIFEGGKKMDLLFPINQTPLFMRENSMFALMSQIYIVYPKIGNRQETFVYGKYSQEFRFIMNHDRIEISVNRFYKDDTIPKNNDVNFRIIGMNNLIFSENLQMKKDSTSIRLKGKVNEKIILNLSKSNILAQ